MASSKIASKLREWANKLEDDLERQRLKGGVAILLIEEEVAKLIDVLNDGHCEIDCLINGGP